MPEPATTGMMTPSGPLASEGRRLGGFALEFLLIIVTLAIGWLVWWLIVWARGQTPAKQVLKMRVIDSRTGFPASWGRMCLREFVAKGLLMSAISLVTLGIGPLILYFMILWTRNRQQLWDKVAGTYVVDQSRMAPTS